MGLRTLERAVVGTLLSVTVVVRPSPASSQTILGRVLEDDGVRPIVGASVALMDQKGRAVIRVDTDTLGRFTLVPPKANAYVIEVVALGYETTRSPLLALHEEGQVPVDLLVRPLPIGLEGIAVSVEREIVDRLRGYGLRPEDLGRRWIDRDAIEAVPTAQRAKDLIRWQGVPGIWVREESDSPSVTQLCIGFWRAKSVHSSDPPCARVLLNDVPIGRVEANQISPDEIEAMVVLTPVEATQLYGTDGSAGAVLMWTRRGGRR